jgi:hypothetical protein
MFVHTRLFRELRSPRSILSNPVDVMLITQIIFIVFLHTAAVVGRIGGYRLIIR